MFALVALLCLYAGINNIKKAFILAPFGQWAFINWSLFFTGVAMLAVVVPCVLQATKDLKEKRAQLEQQQTEEKRKKQQQFFYDESEETMEITADSDDEI